MGVNGIDEINDSDERLEQKQEGEENKGLEEEKESGLYPTENLERRKSLRLDKIKENILTIGIKGGMSIDEIDYLVDFILNDDEGFISTSFNEVYTNAKIDISININEKLLFDKEIKFLKVLSDFYNAQRQFTQGEGKKIQKENIQRLINSKMMNIEIEENKQDLPDEDWINQGIMTPKVKAVYYKIRELFEKNCEEYFEFFERPEEGDIDIETKTNGKIIMTFDSSGRPCDLQTPNGTYKSLHMASFDEENLDNFINEVKNTYELKMTTGGYKIEIDY